MSPHPEARPPSNSGAGTRERPGLLRRPLPLALLPFEAVSPSGGWSSRPHTHGWRSGLNRKGASRSLVSGAEQSKGVPRPGCALVGETQSCSPRRTWAPRATLQHVSGPSPACAWAPQEWVSLGPGQAAGTGSSRPRTPEGGLGFPPVNQRLVKAPQKPYDNPVSPFYRAGN